MTALAPGELPSQPREPPDKGDQSSWPTPTVSRSKGSGNRCSDANRANLSPVLEICFKGVQGSVGRVLVAYLLSKSLWNAATSWLSEISISAFPLKSA